MHIESGCKLLTFHFKPKNQPSNPQLIKKEKKTQIKPHLNKNNTIQPLFSFGQSVAANDIREKKNTSNLASETSFLMSRSD